MKENKEMKIKERGITLIALVVTIVILLILAGITIGAISGDNGIINKAKEAKTDAEIAQWNEKIDQAIIDAESKHRNPTMDNVKEELKNKGIITEYSQVNDKTGAITTNEPVATIEGKLDDYLSKIPEGLEIGETVHYDPNGTYNWQSKYCSSPENTSYGKTLNSGDGEPFNINTWKVFDVNETTGEVTLVPEHSTDDGNDGADPNSGTVYLYGAQGYNNGVKLLNDACSTLYGDSNKGITARSINITDIEGKMTDAVLQQAHSSPYGQQVSNAYLQGNSKYPIIYAQEKLNGVNGGSSVLGMSDQTSLIEPTANGATNGYIQGNGLKPTQTYWEGDNSFMQSAFETAPNGISYYSLLMPDDTDTYYWVASRCVYTYSDYCNFNVSYVNGGGMYADIMFYSDGRGGDNDYYGLFPVVSLSSELISGDASSGFSVE